MPRGRKSNPDDNRVILEYALRHLERELEEVQAKIAHVKSQMGVAPRTAVAAGRPAPPAPVAVADGRKQRVLSPAARARIALAQKKRWAAHRKAKAQAAKD